MHIGWVRFFKLFIGCFKRDQTITKNKQRLGSAGEIKVCDGYLRKVCVGKRVRRFWVDTIFFVVKISGRCSLVQM